MSTRLFLTAAQQGAGPSTADTLLVGGDVSARCLITNVDATSMVHVRANSPFTTTIFSRNLGPGESILISGQAIYVAGLGASARVSAEFFE